MGRWKSWQFCSFYRSVICFSLLIAFHHCSVLKVNVWLPWFGSTLSHPRSSWLDTCLVSKWRMTECQFFSDTKLPHVTSANLLHKTTPYVPTTRKDVFLEQPNNWTASKQTHHILWRMLFNDAKNYEVYAASLIDEWRAKRHWWKLTGEKKYSRKIQSQCYFIHHKSHIMWHWIENGPPRWQAGD